MPQIPKIIFDRKAVTLESTKGMAHKRPAEDNTIPTACRSQGCDRVAFGTHRFCCSQCKHSNGIVHGHRCGFRQETFREPSPPKQNSSSDVQLQNLKALVASCLPDLPVEECRRWLRDLLRAFHGDRYSALSGHHLPRDAFVKVFVLHLLVRATFPKC